MPPKKDEKGKGGAKDKGKAAGGAKGGKAKDGELDYPRIYRVIRV